MCVPLNRTIVLGCKTFQSNKMWCDFNILSLITVLSRFHANLSENQYFCTNNSSITPEQMNASKYILAPRSRNYYFHVCECKLTSLFGKFLYCCNDHYDVQTQKFANKNKFIILISRSYLVIAEKNTLLSLKKITYFYVSEKVENHHLLKVTNHLLKAD